MGYDFKDDQVDWREVVFPPEATPDDLFEFMKMNMTFSINIRSKDPRTTAWIRDHKDWIKIGGE